MPEGERRLAAIMFTDMVGYTALGQMNESLSLALVKEQKKLIRPILDRHNGREVKTIGDAFLAEFPNALDAVRCAYDIQRATREYNFSLPEDRRIYLRIGVHVGDIVEDKGDISGDSVNIASRIEPIAEAGGVCLSRQVFDQVQNKFELPLENLGFRPLKNVNVPIEIFKMSMPWDSGGKVSSSQLDRRRIAILPFVSMSPDPADDYFADGLTEELISSISRLSSLQVIARTSVMSYKGGKKSVGEIANELEVGTLLEGSVRKAGNRLRITVQLIDTLTSVHIWAETYDRSFDDIFAIQSDVSKNVADFLRVNLLRGEAERLEGRGPKNVSAYVPFLKGQSLLTKRKPDELKEAKEMFEAAIREDPSYGSAYAGLADTYLLMKDAWVDLGMDRNKAKDEARALAMRAIELNPNLAEARTTLASLLSSEGQYSEAEAEFKKAIFLNPNYARAHHWYALLLQDLGRMQEALRELELAERLDPLTITIHTIRFVLLWFMGKESEATRSIEKAIRIDAKNYIVLDMQGHYEYLSGNYTKAKECWEEASKLSGISFASDLAMLYSAIGDAKKALACVEEMKALPQETQFRSLFLVATYAGVGDDEGFFTVAKQGVKDGSLGFGLIRLIPTLYPPSRGFSKDPRWNALFNDAGLDPS